jgi:hypothetical protein
VITPPNNTQPNHNTLTEQANTKAGNNTHRLNKTTTHTNKTKIETQNNPRPINDDNQAPQTSKLPSSVTPQMATWQKQNRKAKTHPQPTSQQTKNHKAPPGKIKNQLSNNHTQTTNQIRTKKINPHYHSQTCNPDQNNYNTTTIRLMSSDPALDTLKWERETTRVLLDTLQTHGPPNQATRALVNHRPFANGRALNLYHFEHKNNIWVAEDNLPATFYIYATATPTKKITTSTFMKNILDTITIPTYANTLNPQCIVAIGLFTAITPRRQKELNQLVPCPLIHMDGKNPQILEMTRVWPLPHPYKINPEMDSKNKHRLRVQQYFPLTEPQHKALWKHCQNEFSLVLRTHTKNKRKEPTTTKHQTTNTHAEMNPPAAVAPNSVEKTKRKAPQQALEAEGSAPMDTSTTEGTTSLVPYPTEEAKQKENKSQTRQTATQANQT